MFLQVENFLAPAEVQAITEIAREAKFIDGRRSDPHNVTKDNAIADPNDPTTLKAGRSRSRLCSAASRPATSCFRSASPCPRCTATPPG